MSNLPIRDHGPFPGSHTNPNMNGASVPVADAGYLNPYKSRDQQKDELKHYLRILYRRKWCVIVPVIVLVPLITLVILLDDPSYRATSRVLIKNRSDRVLDIQEVVPSEKNEAFYPTAYELLRSEENVSEVLHTLGLIEVFPLETWNPIATMKSRLRAIKNEIKSLVISKPERAPLTPEEIAEIKRQEALSYFHSMLRVKPLEGNMLVDVSFEDPKPKRAALIVNTLISIYVRNNRSDKLESVTNATEWLTKQSKNLRKQMLEGEVKLQQFRKNKDFVSFDLDEKKNVVLENLSYLNAQHQKAKVDLDDIERQLNDINSLSTTRIEDIKTIPPYIDNHLIQSIMTMRNQYVNLELEYANNIKRYRAKHPSMILLEAKMEKLENSIAAEFQKAIRSLQTTYKIASFKVTNLSEQLTEQKAASQRLNDGMLTYQTLKLDAKNFRDLYLEATNRLRELKLIQASAIQDVKIVKKASAPIKPMPSKALIKLFAGTAFACFLGVALAFGRERFDARFKAPDEIEALLNLPLLGVIPHNLVCAQQNISQQAFSLPVPEVAEAYRVLRTRLLAAAPGMKTLLITSAVPAEGKSTTTAQLGFSYACMGMKVLLVDTDFRRPTLHRHFWVYSAEGLATALYRGGAEDWHELLQDTPIDNLKVMPAGLCTNHASDLLSQPAMQHLLVAFRNEFDLVIFDSPLVLSLSDVEIMAPHMDGVLLVHCPDQCYKPSVLKAVHQLERIKTPLLGIVLNNIRSQEEKYYYERHDYTPAQGYLDRGTVEIKS